MLRWKEIIRIIYIKEASWSELVSHALLGERETFCFHHVDGGEGPCDL